MEPLDAGFGFAVLCFFDEFGDIVLIEDRDTLEQRDFNLVGAGEKERFPFLFRAFFDSQLP